MPYLLIKAKAVLTQLALDAGVVFSIGNVVMFWKTGGVSLALTVLSFALTVSQVLFRNSSRLQKRLLSQGKFGKRLGGILKRPFTPLLTHSSLLGFAGFVGFLTSDFTWTTVLAPLSAMSFSAGNLIFAAARTLHPSRRTQKALVRVDRFLSPAFVAVAYGLIAALAGSSAQAAIPMIASGTGGALSIAGKDRFAYLTFAIASGLTALVAAHNGITDVATYSCLYAIGRLYFCFGKNPRTAKAMPEQI